MKKPAPPSARIKAVEKLYKAGYDIAIRLSPFIPEFVDYDKLASIDCDKLLVEFLRVNSWVKKWFDIDYSQYTVSQSNYLHLPLEVKKEYLSKIHGFAEISVCDDESEAYEYFNHYYNPNPYDCCNLRN